MTAVGIDLGTTNSVVSICRRNIPVTVPVDGQSALPSVVSFRDDGSVLVGRAAKARIMISPEKTVSSAKRFMGDRRKIYRIGHRSLSPTNIATIILRRLVESASQKLEKKVWDAVITVPAYFNEAQREDTKRAGEEAGLNVLRLVPEPTAAAIAYGLDKGKDQTIMVYDLGGGTFDVSILAVKKNTFEVRAVGGDTQLGGDDFDQILMTWASEKFFRQTGVSPRSCGVREGMVAQQRLKEACETAKMELSESKSAVISVPEYLGRPLEIEISRLEYNTLITPLLQKTVQCMKSVLRDARMGTCDIDRVILVGGATKTRLVKEVIADEIKEPYIAEHVDEVVSHGAAIMAASLFVPGEDLRPAEDVLPAIQVTDVIGHSLGVDALGEDEAVVFIPIIPRQSHYPCRRGFLGSTSRQMQTQVDMRVYRGESRDPAQNFYLGELSLPVKPPQKEPVPIGAIFELDANGIIHFTAVQLPITRELQPIVQYAMEHAGELDLQVVDKLIEKGLAGTKTVDIKYAE